MKQDPAVRQEAESVLERLFSSIGGANSDPSSANMLSGLGVQFSEFVLLPVELAEIFVGMSTELTKLVLNSLAEAGITLVRGLSPV